MLTVSNSELQAWRDCKRKWYLRYYLWLAPVEEHPTGVRQLGTRIHAALEFYYRNSRDPVSVLATVYDKAKSDYPDAEQLLEKERVLAKTMVEGYLEWLEETGADEDIEVVGAEEDVRVPGPFAGTRLRARLDVRVRRRSDGKRLFIDHKSVGSFAGAQKQLHMAGQMRFYSMLDRALGGRDGEYTDGGLYNMLRRTARTAKAKPPFYQRVPVTYNEEELRSEWLRTAATVAEILSARQRLDAGEDHRYVVYSHPTSESSWKCPYYNNLCPEMDDGSRWEDAARDSFVQQDPYVYYEPTVLDE